MIDRAYLSFKPPNFSEHALHQDLHSFLQLLLPAQATQELSSTCGKPEMGLLQILSGLKCILSLFPEGEGPSKMGWSLINLQKS